MKILKFDKSIFTLGKPGLNVNLLSGSLRGVAAMAVRGVRTSIISCGNIKQSIREKRMDNWCV